MTTVAIIFGIIIVVQLIYILKLRNGIKYAVTILEKYETALRIEGIIGKVEENGKTDD